LRYAGSILPTAAAAAAPWLASRQQPTQCDEARKWSPDQQRMVGRHSAKWSGTFAAPSPGLSLRNRPVHDALRIAVATVEGNAHSEDRWAFDEVWFGGQPVMLLGVYDGHGGWQVAHYLEQNLLSTIKGSKMSNSKPESIKEAMRASFKEVDEQLDARIRPSLGYGFDRFARIGACAITAAVTNDHYVVANAGDCRAVLSSNGKARPLSNTHNANDDVERARLRKKYGDDAVRCQHGWLDPDNGVIFIRPARGRTPIETNCYICGVLQPSRCFGDFYLKKEEYNVNRRTGGPLVAAATKMPYISAEPEITVVARKKGDDVLVIGSDGLFDYLGDQETIDIARAASTPEQAARALKDEVLKRALESANLTQATYAKLSPADRREVHDDVTVVVCFLQYPKEWVDKWFSLANQLQDIANEASKNTPGTQQHEWSVAIADPLLEDCPLVAVSKGFEKLTGYGMTDIVGRNCRFLSYDVPEHLRDEGMTQRLKDYTRIATSGDPFSVELVMPPAWAPEDRVDSSSFFARWNKRKDGELFLNVFLLRQIWVGDRTYIVALQTRMPESFKEPTPAQLIEMNKLFRELGQNLLARMDSLEPLLTPDSLLSSLADQ